MHLYNGGYKEKNIDVIDKKNCIESAHKFYHDYYLETPTSYTVDIFCVNKMNKYDYVEVRCEKSGECNV